MIHVGDPVVVPSTRFLRLAAVSAATLAGLGVWAVRTAPDAGPTETALLYAPTPAVRLDKMVPDTAITGALVVALPNVQVLGNARKEALFARLIDVASRYSQVAVLVDRDEPDAILTIRSMITAHVEEPSRVFARTTFVRALIDTEWVRDYGPLFGTKGGELVLLDNMYRDIRSEAATGRTLGGTSGFAFSPPPGRYASDFGTFWRRNDDAAPMYFNEIVYAQTRHFGKLVRTPLQLVGGDAAFTSDGQMFTSTRTLEINGGDESRFSRLASTYFNATRVNFLRPLPHSIWHIDMFFRVAGPNLIILGELPSGLTTQSEYLRVLNDEAMTILEWNRRLIEERLPGVEIVRMPMAPPIPALRSLSTVMYRSFLNSVFIRGGDGHSAVVAPTFSGLESMEVSARAAYERVYPHADVHFINADILAEEFGGIHCITTTIPDERHR